MGAEEAGGDEEGLVFFLAHHLDDFGGDHAVSLFFIGALGFEPANGAADFSSGFGVEDEVLVGFVAALRVNRFLPRRGVVEAIGADTGRDVVVVDFSDARGEVVGFDELL